MKQWAKERKATVRALMVKAILDRACKEGECESDGENGFFGVWGGEKSDVMEG